MAVSRRLLLTAVLAAAVVLVLAAAPVRAARWPGRSLLDWGGNVWAGSGDGWWGWSPYWGYGGWSRRPSDPVGSGCYHPETLVRYRDREVGYCSNGNTIRCDWGNWVGSCRDWVS